MTTDLSAGLPLALAERFPQGLETPIPVQLRDVIDTLLKSHPGSDESQINCANSSTPCSSSTRAAMSPRSSGHIKLRTISTEPRIASLANST